MPNTVAPRSPQCLEYDTAVGEIGSSLLDVASWNICWDFDAGDVRFLGQLGALGRGKVIGRRGRDAVPVVQTFSNIAFSRCGQT
jgi:hypothetical protein